MVNYSELRDIQKREMDSSGIVQLPDDFYSTVSKLLTLKKEEAVKSQSIMSIKEYENIRKILFGIQSKREEKLVLMAVRGETSDNGLTSEEKEMLKELSSIVSKSHEAIKLSWDNDNAVSADSLRIRILQEVAQYKGIDNVVYGPFTPGVEVVLPKGEADWLLKAKLAEIA